jgi:ribosome-binding ATPase YchF (GTP1/OBG family)
LRIALIGHQCSGRTTLLRALGGSGSIDPAKPVTVPVPDPRLDALFEYYAPPRAVHASVTFTDTPSPVFTPRNLNLLRGAQALALVVDNFATGDLDMSFTESETSLILSDLETTENRMSRLRKEGAVRSRENCLLEEIAAHLSDGRPLRLMEMDQAARQALSPFGLLSLKPLLVVSNRTSTPVSDESSLESLSLESGGRFLPVDAAFELELTEIDEEERPEFLGSMGYGDSALQRLLAESYALLDLMTFFTVGRDEVRAWPVRRGTCALEAAGTIHSDMARGFIRAQVIPFETWKNCPDTSELRACGAIGIEGKEYPVSDGDIIEIRFSV